MLESDDWASAVAILIWVARAATGGQGAVWALVLPRVLSRFTTVVCVDVCVLQEDRTAQSCLCPSMASALWLGRTGPAAHQLQHAPLQSSAEEHWQKLLWAGPEGMRVGGIDLLSVTKWHVQGRETHLAPCPSSPTANRKSWFQDHQSGRADLSPSETGAWDSRLSTSLGQHRRANPVDMGAVIQHHDIVVDPTTTLSHCGGGEGDHLPSHLHLTAYGGLESWPWGHKNGIIGPAPHRQQHLRKPILHLPRAVE